MVLTLKDFTEEPARNMPKTLASLWATNAGMLQNGCSLREQSKQNFQGNSGESRGLFEVLCFLKRIYSSPVFYLTNISKPSVSHPLGGADTAQLRIPGTMKTLICYEIIFDVNVKWCPFELSNEAWCISTAPNLTS